MVKKLKNNDFLFKILSLAIAIGLWFYVAYAENPDIEVWFQGVSVVYEGDDVLAENGLVRMKDDEIKNISLKVKGSRSALFALSSHDISATVDLGGITTDSAHSLTVSVKFPVQGLEVVDRKPYNIPVTTEKIVEAEKNVELEYLGVLQDDVSIEGSKLSVEKVTISGPESVVESVVSCVAQLDISDTTVTKTVPVKLRLKLADGTVTDNPDVKFSNTHTVVELNVNTTKTVPVKADITNADEFDIKEIKISPVDVKLTGTSIALNGITEIMTEPFKLDDSELSCTKNLTLPEGVDNASATSVDIEIILQ